jgi:hypothetical protein
VVRVAVQLLAHSNRRAGCMMLGPGPPCWVRWKSEGSALSPAGLGESGGILVTGGQLHAPRAAVWLLLPWAGLHDAWDLASAP